jgi:hypothetical protein
MPQTTGHKLIPQRLTRTNPLKRAIELKGRKRGRVSRLRAQRRTSDTPSRIVSYRN